MNEVELVRSLGDDLANGGGVPATVRDPLLREIVDAERRRIRPRRSWSLRLRVLSALSAGIIVVAGVVTAVRMVDSDRPEEAVGRDAEAVNVLQNAARVALTRAEPAPRPDQFAFVESIDHYSMRIVQPGGSVQTDDRGPQNRRVWWSIDGTRAGLLRTRPMSSPEAAAMEAPVPAGVRGYRPDLPVDGAAMLAYLYKNSQGDNPKDVQAFVTAGDLARGTYLTAEQQAALYNAIAMIPGVSYRSDVVDVLGRRGVGVIVRRIDASTGASADSDGDKGTMLIFNPTTWLYLGTGVTARLRQGIVDRIGEVPPA